MTASGPLTIRTFDPAPVICTILSVSLTGAIATAAARESGKQAAPPISVLTKSRRFEEKSTAYIVLCGQRQLKARCQGWSRRCVSSSPC